MDMNDFSNFNFFSDFDHKNLAILALSYPDGE